MSTFFAFIAVCNPTNSTRPQEKVVLEAASADAAVEAAKQELIGRGFAIKPDFEYEPFAVEAGSNEHYRIESDIHDLVPDLPTEGTGYCRSFSAKRERGDKTYIDWENEIATPALEAAGFQLTWCWCDGERDSFGPLSRVTNAIKDGKHYEISYG